MERCFRKLPSNESDIGSKCAVIHLQGLVHVYVGNGELVAAGKSCLMEAFIPVCGASSTTCHLRLVIKPISSEISHFCKILQIKQLIHNLLISVFTECDLTRAYWQMRVLWQYTCAVSLADLVCTVHLNIIQSLQTIDVTAGVLLLVRVSTTNQWELVRFGKDQETDRRAQLALMILPFVDLLSQVKIYNKIN